MGQLTDTSKRLMQEYQSVFGETLNAIKSGGWGYASAGDVVDITRPADGVVWSKYGAASAVLMNVPIYRAIDKLVQTIAATPWEVVDGAGNVLGTSEDPDGKEPVTALLHEYAWRNDGLPIFASWIEHLSITGESYIELVRDDDGMMVTALEFINSLSINPVSNNGLEIDYFQYQAAAEYFTLNRRDIIFDRYRSNLFTEVSGYSPVMAAIGSNTVGIMQAAGRAVMAYFNNDGLPGSMITPKDGRAEFSNVDRDNIRKALKENKKAGNKYTTGVFPYPMDVAIFDAPDLQKWTELIRSVEPKAFLALGVPRAIAGDSDSTTLQASPEDQKHFHETVTGILRRIQGVMRTRIAPAIYMRRKAPVDFRFDLTAYQHINEQSRIATRDAFHDGVIDEAEYREVLHREPRAQAAPVTVQTPTPAEPAALPENTTDVIQASEPLTVNPPVRTKAQETALEELEAWRVKAKKRGARKCVEFETEHIDADLCAHIRHALKHDDVTVFARVGAVLRGRVPAELPSDVAPFVEMYRAGLQAYGVEDTAPHVKTFALSVMAAKAIQATRLDFELSVETLLFEAVAGSITSAQFQGRMRSMIQTYSYKAYVDGMRDGGVDDLPTEEDDALIVTHIKDQYTYVRAISEAIYKDGRVTEEEAAGKPEMWFNKSILPAYYGGIESASRDALYEWVIDLANENCASCLALTGQKRRMSFWGRNVRPKADGLMCGGFRCGCQLVPSTGTASKGKLPRWQFAKSHGVELEVIHAAV